jgi:hypothetical protein
MILRPASRRRSDASSNDGGGLPFQGFDAKSGRPSLTTSGVRIWAAARVSWFGWSVCHP